MTTSFAELMKDDEEVEVVELNDTEQFWLRHSSVIPSALKNARIAIIGVGGIGFPLLNQLAKIGLKNLYIFDFDVVDAHNVGPQGYSWDDVGKIKVEAAKEHIYKTVKTDIYAFNKKITTYHDIRSEMSTPNIICVCIDNMELRKTLGEVMINQRQIPMETCPDLYIDARMSLGTWTIYTFPVKLLKNRHTHNDMLVHMNMQKAINYFHKEGIFTDEEGVQEPCTAREINFTGEAISAKIVSSLLYHYNLRNGLRLNKMEDASLSRNDNDIIKGFFDLDDKVYQHKWMHSFNSLEWQSLLPTWKDKKHRSEYEFCQSTLTMSMEVIKTLLKKLNKKEDYNKVDELINYFGDEEGNSVIVPQNVLDEVVYGYLVELDEAMEEEEDSVDLVEEHIEELNQIDRDREDELNRIIQGLPIPIQVNNQIKFYQLDDETRHVTGWYTITHMELDRSIHTGESTVKLWLNTEDIVELNKIRITMVR